MSIAFDSRPPRSQIEPVALDLIQRHGPSVLGIARRYAVSPEDAEDAYQRALEILLTKAPSTEEAELLPWLKVVVKHEAFALRKKRERDVPAEHDALDAFAGDDLHAADVRAERYDQLRIGAEALRRLKPHETTCLLLKAEGLSYQEIAAQTGWSYTKVNRCLVEGRRAFVARVQGIESGEECRRMEPLLSALADGEADAQDMATLRPHLRGCAACRATLRDYREAPRRVAGVAPLPVAGAGVLAWLGDRVWAAVGWVKSSIDAVAAPKVAAVAVSTVAVAGGGAVTVQAVDHQPSQRAPKHVAIAPTVAAPKPALPGAAPAAVRSAGTSAAPRRRPKPAAKKSTQHAPATPPPTVAPAATAPKPSAPRAQATAEPRTAPKNPPPNADEDPGEFGP